MQDNQSAEIEPESNEETEQDEDVTEQLESADAAVFLETSHIEELPELEGAEDRPSVPLMSIAEAEVIAKTEAEAEADDALEPDAAQPRSWHADFRNFRVAAAGYSFVLALLLTGLGLLYFRDDGAVLVANAESKLQEVQSQLATEQSARVVAEGKVTQLLAELAGETLFKETAARDMAELSARLEAERKARAESEDAARMAKEALSQVASTSSVPVAPVEPAPVPEQGASVQPEPVETPPAVEDSVSELRTVSGTSEKPDPARAELHDGQKLFAKGDVAAARQAFGRAIKLGLPEGALALGTTYDPVSLAKAGVKVAGDQERARHWYRRAHELAQRQTQQ